MRKRLPLLLFLLLPIIVDAQKNSWRVGINPFSIFEPQLAIGPSTEYFFSDKFSLWLEPALLIKESYLNPGRANLAGFRVIFQPRFYKGDYKTFFLAPELRVKRFQYDFTGTFINEHASDTLSSFGHKAVQTIAGGAFVIGKQVYLKKVKLLVEMTGGIGIRQRSIHRKAVPSGYEYYIQRGGFGLAPHYEWDNDSAPYFPLGIRLIWKIG